MLGIGIIGCGAIASRRHLPEYLVNASCRIVGVYDQDYSRAKTVAETFHTNAYQTLDSLLTDCAIDAVSICTSNETHAPISIAACQQGKHVLCEKPMATSVAQGQEMALAAQKNKRILMIAQNQRLDPAHRLAKELLHSGRMGRVLSFQSNFSHGGPEAWLSHPLTKDLWFFDSTRTKFGVLGDLGIHKLDLLCWLLEDTVQKVFSCLCTADKRFADGRSIPVDDNAALVLQFGKGAIGTLLSSWTSYGATENATLLNCEKGILRLHCGQQPFARIDKESVLHCHEQDLLRLSPKQASSGIIDLFVESIEKGVSAISAQSALHAMEIIEQCSPV